MKTDRLIEMEKYVLQKETVSMEELRARFDVSMNTVRRDVNELLCKGVAEKVYGGVCARKTPEQSLVPFECRRIDNEQAKRSIGERAAAMVRDGDVIYLDSGTTTLHVAEHLARRAELTVVTNNLEAIVRLVPCENITVIVLPGQLRRKTNSFTGLEAARALRGYNIRLALMASSGATLHGVTNSSPLEYEIKRSALEISQSSGLLLAADKFGVAGLMTYATFGDFDSIITERPLSKEFEQRIAESGSQLIIAG